jgi:hypothetical protein
MSTGKEREQWNTKEKVAAEASKWTTKADFAKHSQSAYQAARRLNCLDEVCAHMEKPKRGRKKGSTKSAKTATTETAVVAPTSTVTPSV